MTTHIGVAAIRGQWPASVAGQELEESEPRLERQGWSSKPMHPDGRGAVGHRLERDLAEAGLREPAADRRRPVGLTTMARPDHGAGWRGQPWQGRDRSRNVTRR